MAKQVQLRRGTTAELSSVTGAAGEVIVDTTKDTLTVHDAYTAGGIPLLREDVDNLANQTIPISKIVKGDSGQYLATNGSGTDLEWVDLDASGRVIIRDYQIDTTQYSFGTSWTAGKVWNNITGIPIGADVKVTFNIYGRDSTTSWGGGYTALYISNDGGSSYVDWRSDGYGSGNIMNNGSESIGQSERTIMLKNYQYTQIRFRYYHRSYDGTFHCNHTSESDLGASPNYGNYSSTGGGAPSWPGFGWARNSMLVEVIV